MSPIWVPDPVVVILHDRQIARHGGAAGMRDRGLLVGALAQPRNLAANDAPDLAVLAAAYAFGIAKAHSFVDGNKRTAFVTAATFLRLNGLHMRPMPLDGVRMMEELAAGDLSEVAFSERLRQSARPLE